MYFKEEILNEIKLESGFSPKMISIIDGTISDNFDCVFEKGIIHVLPIALKNHEFIRESIFQCVSQDSTFENENILELSSLFKKIENMVFVKSIVEYLNVVCNNDLVYNENTDKIYIK